MDIAAVAIMLALAIWESPGWIGFILGVVAGVCWDGYKGRSREEAPLPNPDRPNYDSYAPLVCVGGGAH